MREVGVCVHWAIFPGKTKIPAGKPVQSGSRLPAANSKMVKMGVKSHLYTLSSPTWSQLCAETAGFNCTQCSLNYTVRKFTESIRYYWCWHKVPLSFSAATQASNLESVRIFLKSKTKNFRRWLIPNDFVARVLLLSLLSRSNSREVSWTLERDIQGINYCSR